METIIRQATKDDTEAIWTFIKHAYGTGQQGTSRFKYPERWIWQFLDNPFVNEGGNKLPIWLAIRNNSIVGQMCALPASMKIGDQTYNGSWGCDFIVSRECRGQGIGHKLTEIYYKHFQVCVGITMAGTTRRIWEKFNPVPLRPMHIFLYPIKLDKNIFHYFLGDKFGPLQNISAKLGDVLFSIKRKFNRMLKNEVKSFIQEIFEFSTAIDSLSENTYRDYNAIVKRESKYLNWRFFCNKEFKYKVFVSKNNDQIKGYVVVRKPHPAELSLGHIVDFYAAKNDVDTLKDLILFAIRFFGKSVTTIKCSSSAINIEKLLQKYGFIRANRMKPLMLVSDLAIREKVKNLTEDWFMTLADQDLDQVVFNLDINQPI